MVTTTDRDGRDGLDGDPGDRSQGSAGGGPASTLDELLTRALPDLKRRLARSRWVARLGDESVDDLVQSVCREALEGHAGFEHRGEAQFHSWIHTLVRRKLLDRARHWRAGRRELGRRERLSYTDTPDIVQAEPTESELERADRAALVASALERISADQAAVLRLQLEESLCTAEIARRLGKSPVAVRILRSRGLAKLACILPPSTKAAMDPTEVRARRTAGS